MCLCDYLPLFCSKMITKQRERLNSLICLASYYHQLRWDAQWELADYGSRLSREGRRRAAPCFFWIDLSDFALALDHDCSWQQTHRLCIRLFDWITCQGKRRRSWWACRVSWRWIGRGSCWYEESQRRRLCPDSLVPVRRKWTLLLGKRPPWLPFR